MKIQLKILITKFNKKVVRCRKIASFEIMEFLALILLLLPFGFAYKILKRRKDLIYLLPSFLFILISFLSTNLEAFFEPDLFNFLEHLSIMLAGIVLLAGLLIKRIYLDKLTRKSKIE